MTGRREAVDTSFRRHFRSRSPSSEWLRLLSSERTALALLGALVIGAPQLYGGVFPWTVVVIVGLSLAALAASLWVTRAAPPVPTPWLLLVMCLAAAFTVVQAMPLPCGLVATLAPESASELRAALSLLQTPELGACHLSRDPGATRLEVLKGAGILAAFVASWLLSARTSRGSVIWLCAWSTLAISVVAHLHMALGLTEVFGVYRPRHAGNAVQLAPLMNPNTLGGFAALGVPLWLGILLHTRSPRRRLLAALAIALTAATALLSLSRGAMAMLLGCVALMLFLTQTRRRRSRRRRTSDHGSARWLPRLAVGASLGLGVGFAGWLAADQVLEQFGQDPWDKFDLIGRAFAFAAQHPWLGVGRGAFGSTFVGTGGAHYSVHAENFLAQWAADWGIPLTVLLVVAIGVALWLAVASAQSLRRLGAITGIVGLGAQNLVDLGLELLGVAVVASALLAAVTAPSAPGHKPRAAARRVPMQRVALGVGFFAAFSLLWLGPRVEAESKKELERALRAEISAEDRGDFRRLLERALRLHPTDPVFAVLAAGEALAHDDPRTPRWINRALQVAPGWTAPHVQAFQWLWQQGRHDQALLELRAAAETNLLGLRRYICLAARRGSEAVLRAAPRRNVQVRGEFLEIAASCQAATEAVTQALDAVLMREFPERSAPRERRAIRLARAGDLGAALAELDRMPHDGRAAVVRVQLLFAAKRYAEAAARARELAPQADSREAAELWTLRARALTELGDDEGWRRAVGRLRQIVSADVKRLADTYALEGELHRRRGQSASALGAYKQAYRIKSEPSYLAHYGGISLRLGDKAAALWAYMRLCGLQPEHPDYCATRDRMLEETRAGEFETKMPE